MFIKLYDKFRVNVNNIRSYYPLDDTRIKILLYKPIDEGRYLYEILMCSQKNLRDAVLIQLDSICSATEVPSNNDYKKEQGIKLE